MYNRRDQEFKNGVQALKDHKWWSQDSDFNYKEEVSQHSFSSAGEGGYHYNSWEQPMIKALFCNTLIGVCVFT